ncbi:MAG: YHYH protein [Cyclobacteriaceae bacterium]
MKRFSRTLMALCLPVLVSMAGCGGDDETPDVVEGEVTLHAAFAEFDQDNFDIYVSGNEVVVETNGMPNHTSPYWASSHELYVAPTVTTEQDMAPGNIATNNMTLRVPASPEKASQSSATSLGPVGLAVSGAAIYNDQEGPNVPIDNAVGSLDYTGAHTGPISYHYHIEPKAWTDDDSELVGVLSDGFFLYGRKCFSTGAYPADLDASNGHTAATQYSDGEAEYHYHTSNEVYLGQYYLLFPGEYQGTPNAIQ